MYQIFWRNKECISCLDSSLTLFNLNLIFKKCNTGWIEYIKICSVLKQNDGVVRILKMVKKTWCIWKGIQCPQNKCPYSWLIPAWRLLNFKYTLHIRFRQISLTSGTEVLGLNVMARLGQNTAEHPSYVLNIITYSGDQQVI